MQNRRVVPRQISCVGVQGPGLTYKQPPFTWVKSAGSLSVVRARPGAIDGWRWVDSISFKK